MKTDRTKLKRNLTCFIIFLTMLILPGIKVSAANSADPLLYAKQLIQTYYIGDVTESQLNAATDVDSLVKSLNDPYSAYFTEQEYTEFINSINNSFSGIGVQIDKSTDGIKVITVFDGTPAKAAGLAAGDIILTADGHELSQLSVEESVKYIKGLSGTRVNLQVKRNDDILTFNVERTDIVLPTVENEMIDNHIGYIKITSFGEKTGSEFQTALTKLKAYTPDCYIIDLRNNGGGYMSTAFDIAGYFIGDNTVLKTQAKSGQASSYNATKQDILIDKPTIFLINGYSASASEILAAAVKDNKKALFIGEKTYGKGVAQNIFMLPDSSYMKLTTLKFVSPLGNEINKVGITPDIIVKDDLDNGISSLNAARILLSSINRNGDGSFTAAGNTYNVNLTTAKSQNNLNTFLYLKANYKYVQSQVSSTENNTGDSMDTAALPNTGSALDFQNLSLTGIILMLSGAFVLKRLQ